MRSKAEPCGASSKKVPVHTIRALPAPATLYPVVYVFVQLQIRVSRFLRVDRAIVVTTGVRVQAIMIFYAYYVGHWNT